MKKILKIIIILLIPLIIVSCGKKDYREGELVELSGLELTNNFSGDNCKDFIFATVNDTKKGYKEFLSDLKKYAKESNKAIYYTDYNHIDTDAALYIFNLYEADFTSNAYHVIEDGKITLTKTYKDYTTMKFYLNNKRFYSILDYTSDKDINKYLKKAEEEYNKGNISVSFNYINKIWNRDEAKKFYNTHEKLGIIKAWEHSRLKGNKDNTITYRSLLFHHNTNYFLEIVTKGAYETFEKPTNMIDYNQVYYYVKDDIIYTSNKIDGKYTQRFKIIKVEKTSFKVFDYKYNKEFTYSRRV